MKHWKITNITKENIKLACKTSPQSSRGIILEPNQFCLAEPQSTASIEIQERRGFITIDRNFDNIKLQLELVKAYSTETLDFPTSVSPKSKQTSTKSKFEEAQEGAKKYMGDN